MKNAILRRTPSLKLKLAVVVAASFVLAGCAPKPQKISGSIFIVTKGGNNYKLGGIAVQAIEVSRFNQAMLETKTEREKCIQDLQKATTKLCTLVEQYHNEQETKALTDPVVKKILEQQICWAQQAERLLQYSNLLSIVRFKARGESTFGKSDADGKFNLRVLPKCDYIIVAEAFREIFGGAVEHYVWQLDYNQNDAVQQLLLSNDNTATEDITGPVYSSYLTPEVGEACAMCVLDAVVGGPTNWRLQLQRQDLHIVFHCPPQCDYLEVFARLDQRLAPFNWTRESIQDRGERNYEVTYKHL